MSVHNNRGVNAFQALSEARDMHRREHEKWAKENPTQERVLINVDGHTVQYERPKGLTAEQKKQEDAYAKSDYREATKYYDQ